jgi:ATP-binding cassette subfamily B protein
VDEPAGHATQGPSPGDGVRFEGVSFTYPGASEPAVHDVSFHLRPGRSLALVGENGSGKTTLIKLLTRLYVPSQGRIKLDGLDLAEWEPSALRRRVGVIFQDFARYQLTVGENIGVGDVRHFDDESRWRTAGDLAAATPFVEELPQGFRTQLGKWFKEGRELSGGQWQKIALARAFMREGADILVLDEPTAAMDARAESLIFEQFRELARERMVILISHRFSTVRMADQILVIQGGEILERGSHEELMQLDGHYAHLFSLQARGYR